MKNRLNGLKAQLQRERDKRDLKIIALRAEGKSLRTIALLVGLSAMRCKQILDRAATQQ